MDKAKRKFVKRKQRARAAVKARAYGKLRLSVHRSNKHVYAQVIDDKAGSTVVSASTIEEEVAAKLSQTSTVEAAAAVGALLAKRAVKALPKDKLAVVFDRGGYLYHGRVKALADAARENGLIF